VRALRVLLFASVAFAALPAASALATTTIGQTASPVRTFNPFQEIVIPSEAVPVGGVTITAFQSQSGTCPFGPGTFDFQVLRPEGGDQYLVVGDTGNHTDPCDAQLHSYPVDIPVQAGDALGVYVGNDWNGDLAGGFPVEAFADISEPAVGDTVSLPGSGTLGVDESATVVTVADHLNDLCAASQGVAPGTSLPDKCAQAQAYLAASDTADACGILTDYISLVNAQTGKKIDPATAGNLIVAAKQIQAELGCS
jgi:hypothetical protein